MKVALIQYSLEWENKEANKQKIDHLTSAMDKGIDLIIFPEMTLTGFSMDSNEISETIDGESYQYFKDLAIGKGAAIIAGIVEREGDKNYNTLIHLDSDGKLKKKYRKIHPFSYADEDKYYMAGEIPVITEMGDWKIGLSICYDLRFPELYRFYGKQRTDLIVNIANWPEKRSEHWKALIRARAIENLSYVIGVNRVGADKTTEYSGNSCVISPLGNILISSEKEETILMTELDKNEVSKARAKYPFLEDIKLI